MMSKMKDRLGDDPFMDFIGRAQRAQADINRLGAGPVAKKIPDADPFEGLERRRRGIDRIEERHKDWILGARHALKHCGKEVVTSDDLHRVFPPPAGMHPNAIGAVFNTVEFTKLNEFVRSARPEAHGRVIQKWRVKR